jgi:3-dehydroquinate synthase
VTAEIRFRGTRQTETRIVVGQDLFADGVLPIPVDRALFVVDERVQALQSDLVDRLARALARDARIVAVRAGEPAKTLEGVARLLGELGAQQARKGDWLVAVGGGTITDLAGFTAQVLYRGTNCALVPTTLMAQVDAAIGGKNGLNVGGRKSRIGSFYWPGWVLCDTRFLDTLPLREVHAGVAEIVKVFAVSDAESFRDLVAAASTARPADRYCRADLVARAVRAKVGLLEADPFETSPRRLLNFGHSFAHFLEERSAFSIEHGEAVLLSMLCEVNVGRLAGVCPPGVCDAFWQAVAPYLPTGVLEAWPPDHQVQEAVVELRAQRGGLVHMVVLSEIGRGLILPDVPWSLLKTAWNDVGARLHRAWS